MKKFLLALITSAACFSSAGLFAENDDFVAPPAPAKSGAVIGIKTGYAIIKTPPSTTLFELDEYLEGLPVYTTSRKGNFTAGMYSGYMFALGRHFLLGPVLAYNWFGNSRYYSSILDGNLGVSKITIQSQALSLLAKEAWIFQSGFNFSTNFGAAYIYQKQIVHATGLFTGLEPSHTARGFRPELGAGVGYQFPSGLGIGVDFDYIFGYESDHLVAKTYGIQSTTVDLSYHFE